MNNKKNIIAFANMKGGVAKTTLCANLAYTLSKQFNKKILLIDMDPQYNLTSLFINEEKLKKEYIDKGISIHALFESGLSILNNDKEKKEIIVKTDRHENLYIIPGTIELFRIAEEAQVVTLLKAYINKNKINEKFDFIFIDCPPTPGKYLSTALKASDFYLTPIKPDYLSSTGIAIHNEVINRFNETYRENDNVDFLGLVFTMVDQNTNHHKSIMEKLKSDYSNKIFKNHISYSVKIPENMMSGKFILDLSETWTKSYIEDIIKLAEEFLNKFKNI